MSDLDQAIRDAVAFGNLPLTGRFEAAFAAVLDLHAPQALYPLVPDDVRCAGCSNHVVRVDYPCATVRGVAEALRVPVSSQDTPPPPRTEPRVWREGDPEPPVGTKLAGGGFTWTRHGRSWQTPEGGVLPWGELTKYCVQLTEVLPSASTDTDGRDQ